MPDYLPIQRFAGGSRKIRGIATPACALVRNDMVLFWDTPVRNNNLSFWRKIPLKALLSGVFFIKKSASEA